MRKLFDKKAGATFNAECPDLTINPRKEGLEFIAKLSPGIYLIINMKRRAADEVLLYANWGDYFNRLQNPDTQLPRIKKTCPTLYAILMEQDKDHIFQFKRRKSETFESGLGIICKVATDEIYNLAAQSHVQVSFDSPEFTADVDAVGVLRVLEAVRQLGMKDTCRIYQASTSELYGKVEEVPQNENTPFHPYSPYAVAKQYGFWIVKEYREAYGMFCCSGILFNHESERRGETFVTRKITLAAARIAQGKQDCLYLGNLDSLRDWGYAKDYVECMWLILQHDTPEDFVIATGVQHTVREFATLAFQHAGIELRWEGEGINEKGIDVKTGKVVVAVSEDFYRPTDVVNLWGDPTKAKNELGWNPQSTSFEELVRIMVAHDMQKVAADHVASVMRTNLAEYLEKGIVK